MSECKSDFEYSADSIQVFRDLEAVRKRPGMYIGDTSKAILQMIFEVLDNSVDEFVMGHCSLIKISNKDDVWTLEDNGRGIPTDIHPKEKISALQLIMTTLHSGGKFGGDSYKYSGGLHGVGVSVVNALSEWLEVIVKREGKIHRMKFIKGVPEGDIEVIGSTEETGTIVSFFPDFSIVDNQKPSKEEIMSRVWDLAYLNPGLEFIMEGDGYEERAKSSSGVVDLLNSNIKGESITPPIFYKSDQVVYALTWKEKSGEENICFTNNIRQVDGGQHLIGLRSALGRAISDYNKKTPKPIDIIGEDIRESILAVLSIKLENPKFSSQVKSKLVSPEARTLVEQFVYNTLSSWLEENPSFAKKILKKILEISLHRKNIAEMKEGFKKVEKNTIQLLSGKLSDCQSNNPEECELFIVEGNSAGGSAKVGRNRKFQAILPIKGKLINVMRCSWQKVMHCEEILSLIAAVGTGIGEKFDISKLRFHKVIIMTDADVDGLHIFSLLVTFFVQFLPEIVKAGYLYVSQPPLFKVTMGKKSSFINTEEDLNNFLLERLLEKVTIVKEDQTLSKEKVGELLREVKSFCSCYDNLPARLAATYGLERQDPKFDLIFSKFFEKYSIKDSYIINIYNNSGIHSYDYKPDKHLFGWPVVMNDKTIYDPLEFYESVNKIMNSGIYIQRYKGLGEMNAEELAETSLEPEHRILEQLSLDSEIIEQALKNISDIMGNEIERRDFVLKNITELFGQN